MRDGERGCKNFLHRLTRLVDLLAQYCCAGLRNDCEKLVSQDAASDKSQFALSIKSKVAPPV